MDDRRTHPVECNISSAPAPRRSFAQSIDFERVQLSILAGVIVFISSVAASPTSSPTALSTRQVSQAACRLGPHSLGRGPLTPSLPTKLRPCSHPSATRRPSHWQPPSQRTRTRFVRCSWGRSLERSSGPFQCHWTCCELYHARSKGKGEAHRFPCSPFH
jgi:hypothetical protein